VSASVIFWGNIVRGKIEEEKNKYSVEWVELLYGNNQ
jgi:hypothetical protein